MSVREKLIVAIDVPDLKEARRLVKILAPAVSIFKVGMELFTAAGPRTIQMIHSHKKKVFLDLKFHDIPNTVGSACLAASKLGVFMMNVHAMGGRNMMLNAIAALKGKTKLIAVTVLTSLVDGDLKEIGVKKKAKEEVRDLAILAKKSGLDGVVASGQEITLIRKATGKDFLIVTPGVRPIWSVQGDQKRIVTPRQALKEGADYIVVGRPITAHQDPRAAAELILKEMSHG